jgi:hypothetical protein
VTVSTQELALGNSVMIAALIEPLQERGILTRQQVLDQVRLIKERSRPQ